MAGKGGGAWKVAYADFVTAMMAFFLVMWITGQSKQVKQAVAHYFNQPYGTASKYSEEAPEVPMGIPGASGMSLPSLTSAARAAELPSAGRPGEPQQGRKGGSPAEDPKSSTKTRRGGVPPQKPAVYTVHNGDRRMVGAVIPFAEGSAALDQEAKARLDRLAPSVLGKPNKVEIRGHASRRPLAPESPFQNAWQLCYARCLAVMEYLENLGVEPERFRLSQGGPFEPYTIREGPDMQAKNSRVEVYMLGEFVEDLLGTSEERAQRQWAPEDEAPAGPK